MIDIVVHGVPGSPFLRAVQMGLEEKRVAYRLQAMTPGEHKAEAYLKKGPPPTKQLSMRRCRWRKYASLN